MVIFNSYVSLPEGKWGTHSIAHVWLELSTCLWYLPGASHTLLHSYKVRQPSCKLVYM